MRWSDYSRVGTRNLPGATSTLSFPCPPRPKALYRAPIRPIGHPPDAQPQLIRSPACEGEGPIRTSVLPAKLCTKFHQPFSAGCVRVPCRWRQDGEEGGEGRSRLNAEIAVRKGRAAITMGTLGRLWRGYCRDPHDGVFAIHRDTAVLMCMLAFLDGF